MKTDIAILGGGIIGAALAEELARRGGRVVLIERGRIGAEASSAAAGILASHVDLKRPGPLFDLCQLGRQLYPAWVRHLERVSRIPVDYHKAGILYLALTQAQVQRMAARQRWQRRHGLRVERWSPAEVRRREPYVDQPVRAGFCFPLEAQVDNVALMRALAVACRRAGVTVWEQTAVTRILHRQGRVHGVLTSRGRVEASTIVNCLGSWANLGGAFPVRLPIRPVRGQILAFEGPRGLFRRAVMSDHGYLVQRRDGRLIVGSTVEFAGFKKCLTLSGVRGILAGLRRMTSAIHGRALVDCWAGLRPFATHGRPILGATRIAGLYVATGHFRHGILLAPITAKLMAELLLRGRASVDLTPFSPGRFHR